MADRRYLTVFNLEVEVVHDEHPDHFGDLLVADINEALRSRGLDDAMVTEWSWRDPTAPGEPARRGGLWVARPGAAEWWPVGIDPGPGGDEPTGIVAPSR